MTWFSWSFRAPAALNQWTGGMVCTGFWLAKWISALVTGRRSEQMSCGVTYGPVTENQRGKCWPVGSKKTNCAALMTTSMCLGPSSQSLRREKSLLLWSCCCWCFWRWLQAAEMTAEVDWLVYQMETCGDSARNQTDSSAGTAGDVQWHWRSRINSLIIN